MLKLKPMWYSNTNAIVFSSNNAFLPYISVMIQSIIDYASAENYYDMIVLHSEITKENQKRIQSMVGNQNNIAIRFFDVSEICKNYSFYTGIADGRLSKETYYRLMISEILDNEFIRAIYLDGDMVALKDLAELYTISLKDYYLAAVPDITGIAACYKPGNTRMAYRTNELGMENPDEYFIGGLLVMNLPEIRKDMSVKNLLDMAASRNWLQHDQDVLNVVCKNKKAKMLHASWNVLEDYGNNRYLPPKLMNEWMESQQDPFIIHYGGSAKPWKKDVARQEYFWSIVAKTPYFKDIVLKMVLSEQKYDETEKLEKTIEVIREKILNGEKLFSRNDIFSEIAKIEGENKAHICLNPKISVIITVYNVEKYIRKCIESIINQTYRNLEIIIVNDGSPDNCGNICDEYAEKDERIRVIHKENGGVASARNVGLAAASGDYIGWVDGDDWIALDMYEYLVKGAEKYRTPVVICGFVNVHENGSYSATYRKQDEVLTTKEALDKLFKFEIRNYLYDRIWERSIFEGVTFDNGVVFEDTRIVYKLLEKARWITLLKHKKYYRLLREGSIVHSNDIKTRLDACKAVIARYEDINKRWPELNDIQYLENFRAIQRLRNAILLSSKSDYKIYAEEIADVVAYLKNNKKETLATIKSGRLEKIEVKAISIGGRIGFKLSNIPVKVASCKKKVLKMKKKLSIKKKLRKFIKKLANKFMPAYRVALRCEEQIGQIKKASSIKNTQGDKAETIYWLQSVRPGETIEDAKKRVFMEMPEWGGDISILQKGNGYLLKRLKEICDENGITFFLIGGTLLGAVRHKGFIPWDDDIDVGMLRDELEKLKEVIAKYEDVKLETYYHSPGPWQTIKLTLNYEPSPFWVDILLYDYAGDSVLEKTELWEKIQKIREKTIKRLWDNRTSLKKEYKDEVIYDQRDNEVIRQIYESNLEILPCVYKREYIYRSIDCVCAKWQQLFPCERIMPFCELEFNGENYKCPKDYEWYLKLQYGDYYTLPNDIGHIHTRFIGDKLEAAEDIFKKLEL